MSDYFEYEGSCRRCLRSSPIPSLMGLIFVLLGCAAFGAGLIFAKSTFLAMVNYSELAIFNYVTYGVIGGIVLFTVLTYLLCALSTGYNAKQCFDSPKKSICGRCCNMFLILCLLFGLFLWILVACFLSYALISAALVTNRQIASGASTAFVMANVLPKEKSDSQAMGQALVPNLPSGASEILRSVLTPQSGDIDMTYFGYSGVVTAAVFDVNKEKFILCISAAFIGVLLMLFGYFIMILCVAMNYARLHETRYYDAEDGDDGVALRQ